MSRINISIVLYNNPMSMLEKAIQSVLNTSLNITLYLIDNSPTDELQILAALDSRIEYIPNHSNPGYGTAHNISIRKSIEAKIPYHLVLNPDIYYSQAVIEEIVNYMDQHSNVGLLMPKILYPNGDMQYLCKLLPTPLDWFGRFVSNYVYSDYFKKQNHIFEMRFANFEMPLEVPYLSGCFMFLRTSTVQKAGLFDENIFLHTEDADLSRRIFEISKNIYYPYVHVYHLHNKEAYRSLKVMFMQIKSIIYYFNKWGWFFDKKRSLVNMQIKQNSKNCEGNYP